MLGLFPNGAYSVRVASLPGTRHKLQNNWRIVVGNQKYDAPLNRSIAPYYQDSDWFGNIVIMQYHQNIKKQSGVMNHVPQEDARVMVDLVQQ